MPDTVVRQKYILIGIGILILVAFFFGVFLTPKSQVIFIDLNESYKGRISGQGIFELEKTLNKTGFYTGLLNGKFNGTIYRLEKPLSVVADIDGRFSGTIFGECKDTECKIIKSGRISGSGEFFLEGKIIEVEKVGLEIPVEYQLFGAVVFILILLKYLGILDRFITWLQLDLFKRKYIRKTDKELYEEMVIFLKENWDIQNIRQVKEVIIDSEVSPQVMEWLVQLSDDNELIIVKYSLGNFRMRMRDAKISDWEREKEEIRKRFMEKRLYDIVKERLESERKEERLRGAIGGVGGEKV